MSNTRLANLLRGALGVESEDSAADAAAEAQKAADTATDAVDTAQKAAEEAQAAADDASKASADADAAADTAADAADDAEAAADEGEEKEVGEGADALTEGEPVGDAEAEAAEVEAAVTADKAEDVTEAVNEAADVAEGLESLHSQVMASMEQGGLSPEAARFLNIATATYSRRAGLVDNDMPSFESYGGAASREEVSMEAESTIRDKIGKIKDAIAAMWKKFIDFAKSLWNKLVAAVKNVWGRLDAQGKKIANLRGAPKLTKITLSEADFSKLNIDGKVDLNNNVKLLSEAADPAALKAGVQKITAGIATWAAEMASKANVNSAITDTKTMKLFDLSLPYLREKFTHNGKEHASSALLPGNVRFLSSVVDASKFSDLNFSMVTDAKSNAKPTAEQLTIEVKTASVLKAINSAQKDFTKKITKFEEVIKGFEKDKTDFETKANGIINKSPEKENAVGNYAALMGLSAARIRVSNGLLSMVRYAHTTNAAMLNVVEREIKAYESAKADTAGAPPATAASEI